MLAHTLDWYDMTDEERRLRDLALEVAEREVAPRAQRHDEEGSFVRDSIDALAEAGLLGVTIPKRYGGLGGTPLAGVMALEAVSAACASTGASYLFHLNLCYMIRRCGPEVLRQKYLPQLATDKLGAFAINEGVRLFREGFETTIEERDGDFVLNGFKRFSTSAGEADVVIIQVQRPGTAPHAFPLLGQEYVLVEKGMPGLSAQVYRPMGLRGASNGAVRLENVVTPRENLVGEQPASMLRAVVAKGQSVIGPNVVAAGIAGAAVEAAARQLIDHGPDEWQNHILGPMSMRLNAMRAYNYFGARLMPVAERGELGGDMTRAHIEPQLQAGIDAPWICDRALEIMGGRSFMDTSPIGRYNRDARGAAYLAFAMDDRRAATADMVYSLEHVARNPETMPWESIASYSFRMSSIAAMTKLPHEVGRGLSRERYEEAARSSGAHEVSLEAYIEHLHAVNDRTGPVRPGPPPAEPGEAAPVGAPDAGAP
jgi:alkylation response protein AidB-like acyl-CoA dehydrogenase